MEKRVIIAFVLSFIVLYAFRSLYSPPVPAPEQQANVQTAAAPTPPSPAPVVANTTSEQKAAEEVAVENLEAGKAEDFTFDTSLYTGTISNVGGVLKSFKLKEYKDGEGHPLELINEAEGPKAGWPLAVITGDKATDDELAKAAFAGHKDADKITLEFAANGLHAQKIVQWDRANYEFTLQTTLTRGGRNIPHAVVWQGGFGDQSIEQGVSSFGVRKESLKLPRRIT